MAGKGRGSGWRRLLLGGTVASAIAFTIFGVLAWGAFNTALEVTNSMEFCISCHEMRDNVYAEYVNSPHEANRSGVRAGCPDCHVPREWGPMVVRKISASRELIYKILGTVDTPEKFEAHRLEMARRVWSTMKRTDSRECRNCHDWDTMDPEKQKPRARKQHLFAMRQGQTCIDCHKGIAHKKVHDLLDDEERDRLEAPVPEFVRPLPERWAKYEERKAAKKLARRKAQDEARQGEAGRKKPASPAAGPAEVAIAPASAAHAAPKASGGSAPPEIAWGRIEPREVVLFYPGQSSWEWTQTGSDHGGARAFRRAGDRCFDCHDEETADMGQKIASGEKLEPTPIPGKRPSIPVQVQAAFDDGSLYVRLTWPDGEHAPVPFVEGGKMDPDDRVKVAIALSTDEVEYAEQAGCWVACHHDLRTMPDAPEGKEVTKYLPESRTALEIRGRGGKPRGGWDKVRPAAEIESLLTAGKIIDLLRVRLDTGRKEDGYILEARHMEGGRGFDAWWELADGTWSLVLRRPLKGAGKGDVDLEPGGIYNFSIAIHDDYAAARYHHVSVGYRLGLGNEDADIVAARL